MWIQWIFSQTMTDSEIIHTSASLSQLPSCHMVPTATGGAWRFAAVLASKYECREYVMFVQSIKGTVYQ